VDLPEKKEKALNIALNKTGGEWDDYKLTSLMREISDGTFDIESTGFDAAEAEMMEQLAPIEIDDLLNELDVSEAIEAPIWATVRTTSENKEILKQVMAPLRKKGMRVEFSYE